LLDRPIVGRLKLPHFLATGDVPDVNGPLLACSARGELFAVRREHDRMDALLLDLEPLHFPVRHDVPEANNPGRLADSEYLAVGREVVGLLLCPPSPLEKEFQAVGPARAIDMLLQPARLGASGSVPEAEVVFRSQRGEEPSVRQEGEHTDCPAMSKSQ